MSKKYTNIINFKDCLNTFHSYDFKVRDINYYQMRISFNDIPNMFFDWYHTTGSLVITTKNYSKGLGKILDPEEVSLKVLKELENNK